MDMTLFLYISNINQKNKNNEKNKNKKKHYTDHLLHNLSFALSHLLAALDQAP